VFLAVRRVNMVRRGWNGVLSRLRRIETLFSEADNFGLRFVRAVSRRGLAVKIILG